MTERSTHRGERGLTLIELMISLVLSAVVIAFVFQIHGQMSDALRGQATVAEISETVTAGREMIARDLRTAGMGFPASGVRYAAGDGEVFVGITVRDDVNGPSMTEKDVSDFLEIQRLKGETIYIERIEDNSGMWKFWAKDRLNNPTDQRPEFQAAPPELVIANGGNTQACVVQLSPPAQVVADGFIFPGNSFNTGACNGVVTTGNGIVVATITPMERVAYRLAQTPQGHALGVLQRHDGVQWQDIGVGFTQFQVAVRYEEVTDANEDADGDGDPRRDWYSGQNMESGNTTRTPAIPLTTIDVPLQVGFSLEARNLQPISGAASQSTVGMTHPFDSDYKDHNPFGNFGEVDGACLSAQYNPCGVPDLDATDLPPRYLRNHIYRSTSTTVWLRNRLGQL